MRRRTSHPRTSSGTGGPSNTGRMRLRRFLLFGAATLLALVGAGSPSVHAAPTPAGAPDFGPNVTIFNPGMTPAEIEAKFAEVHAKQVDNEMGSDRYGLGASPGDVQINGAIEVYNRCFDEDPEFTGCFALNNFWRALSNLTINVNKSDQEGCSASANFWAVSQAVSMRRVDITGGTLSLMDYCTPPSFASGGYIADSRASGDVINGSQQQWYARNSKVGVWTNAVWNQVFSGMTFTGNPGAVPVDSSYPNPPYTVLDKTPVSREKPYLFVDAKGAYQVRVPSAHTNTSGISWEAGMTPGRTIPLSDFFVARPQDSVQTINNQLARGKHLLLTPGDYQVARTVDVKRADTVVLGMGLATLTAVNGATPLAIADRPGVIVAGVTIDAGTVESQVLLQVGKPNGNNGKPNNDPANPTTLSDVYFRVGGPHIGKTDIALEINSNNVLVDHTWVWRADHGIEDFDTSTGDFGDTERWATNIGRNGLVVNGDDVMATGLFVEHFQEYNTIWNGERGRVVLYQNELPYDPPTQADWTTPDGTLGWAGYKVAADVKEHQLWGGGVYVFNRNDPTIVTENGYEVPDAPGVVLTHLMTKNLSGPGTINHVVNGVGEKVDGILPCVGPDDPDNCGPDKAQFEPPSYVIRYSNGVATLP